MAKHQQTRGTRARRLFDDNARAGVLERLEAGDTLTDAARYAGFGRQTVTRAAIRDPEYAKKLDAAVVLGQSQRDASIKFIAEVRAQYLDLLRTGKRRGAAARQLALDPGTVRAYAQQHVEFRQDRRVAEAEADEIIESALFDTAKDGNVRAIEVWLFNRKPNTWRDKRQVGIVNGSNAAEPIPVEVTVQDKTESTLRIGRALEQSGALGASLVAVLGAALSEADGAE